MSTAENDFFRTLAKYVALVTLLSLLTYAAIVRNVEWIGLVAGMATVIVAWRGLFAALAQRRRMHKEG